MATKGFAPTSTPRIKTDILQYANEIAKSAHFKNIIEPVKEWRRPHTIRNISGFELVELGFLTVPETCVMNGFRDRYVTLVQARELGFAAVLFDISQKLEIEQASEILDLLKQPKLLAEKCLEKEIAKETYEGWELTTKDIFDRYNPTGAKAEMEEHQLAFILAMRCDPNWTYEDNNQLSPEERQAIIEFISEEEGIATNDKPQSNQTAKKSTN